ncbi:hypothetical protein L6164_018355 [Bauhinia variegata]|uniref:Uncharacterized protein n=1 Tax=Bauhinia variegata TaxID=167791 RepID=A0ACB9NAR2_BAUVA|nr:hypothetical protein L6164_018355 [Bauhinia variegata]
MMTPPTHYFEVTKPVELSQTKRYSYHILHHYFAFGYGQSPILANYTPPYNYCPSQEFSKIVLDWTATSGGWQFDGIFGACLRGVELLLSCTAEPRPNGIVWSVRKDIIREVYVSFDVIAERKFSDTPGNGPFREFVVPIDHETAGAIWPFPVIYTGGFNPFLWRTITGIGSFTLPHKTSKLHHSWGGYWMDISMY